MKYKVIFGDEDNINRDLFPNPDEDIVEIYDGNISILTYREDMDDDMYRYGIDVDSEDYTESWLIDFEPRDPLIKSELFKALLLEDGCENAEDWDTELNEDIEITY